MAIKLHKSKAIGCAAIVSILAFLHPSSLQAQAGCDGVSMGTFLGKAQTLAADTEAAARPLLACSQGDYREAALFWTGFYFHQTQQDSRFPELLKAWPQSGQNEKNIMRMRAWSGDPQSLKAKIQSGASGFADDMSLLLTLARSSIRSGAYKDGQQAYEIYFHQVENQDAQEAERLYAYIWAGDQRAARLQLASLRRYELSPYLKQAMERAETLLGPDRSAVSTLIGAPGPWLRVSVAQGQDTRGYSKRGLLAAYAGVLDIGIEAYEFQHPLEGDVQNQAQFSLGKIWESSAWRWQAGLGFFSGGDQHLTAVARTEWFPTSTLTFGLGLKREALALVEKPLLGEREGLMRDTAELSFGFRQRLILKAGIHQDDQIQNFETYSAEIRLGTLLTGEWDEGFGFFIPLSYENRPLPSQDFESYPRELRAGLGLRLAVGDGVSYRFGTEAAVEQIRRSYFVDPDSFEELLSGRVRVDARYYATPSLYLFGAADMSLTEKNPYERSNQRETELTIGLALRDSDKY